MMVRIGQLPINEKTSKSQMFVRLPSLAGCGLIRGADWDSMGSDSGGVGQAIRRNGNERAAISRNVPGLRSGSERSVNDFPGRAEERYEASLKPCSGRWR